MKRMTQNPIGYYTIEKEDMKNILPTESPDDPIFTYIPSDKFLQVLKEFKDVLRADWQVILPDMVVSFGTRLSMLYPTNIEDLPEADDKVGYNYDSSTVRGNSLKPLFYKQGGRYYIQFKVR